MAGLLGLCLAKMCIKLQMQSTSRYSADQYVQIRNRIQADNGKDTSPYVQILDSILQADTNRDMFRCGLGHVQILTGYVQIRTNVCTRVCTLIHTNMYAQIRA